jgi:coatomer protein complex subunit gamma
LQEATDLFFSVTKLFISENVQLRRLVLVLIKELSKIADQTFVASNILFKEMNKNTNNDIQANAIRALATITDETTINQLDRHLKQAVVSSSPTVASSALLSGLFLGKVSEEMIKRWTSEIQSVIKSPPKNSRMVQYHALAVLYHLKQNDPLAVSKLITTNTSTFRSPLAHCLLIKYSVKVLRNETAFTNERSKTLLGYLENCLNYENDMVILEAARGLCSLELLSQKELSQAVTSLETFLRSHKQVPKYAALRTLNKLASKYPLLVSLCNNELDSLISDSNRNIATLAITTMLKTGDENNIDRLMKQISTFMSSISDEFKVVLILEMKSLCIKYQQKYPIILNFLSGALTEEGGFEFKKAVIESMITLITTIKDSKDVGIAKLCEFIEDCEFPLLLQQVLHFLGNEGPNTTSPSKCIRYIYNRLLLEKSSVRCAAVSCLAKFGAKCPELRKSVLVILKRSLQDSDDEVRDRTAFALKILSGSDKLIKEFIIDDHVLPLDKLFIVVEKYKTHGDFSIPFAIPDLSKLILPKHEIEVKEVIKEVKEKPVEKTVLPEAFDHLGEAYKVTKAVLLTESDSDYVVACVKYIYEKNIVLEFKCTNKVNGSVLDNVGVKLDLVENIREKLQAKAVRIAFEETESIYVLCSRNPNAFALGAIGSKLTFLFKNVDNDGEVIDDDVDEDEYKLEKLKLQVNDYAVENLECNFKEEWDAIEDAEVGDSFPVTCGSLQECVDKMIDLTGMNPLNDKYVSKKGQHALFFSGIFPNGEKVYLQVKCQEKDGKFGVGVSAKSTSIENAKGYVAAIKTK